MEAALELSNLDRMLALFERTKTKLQDLARDDYREIMAIEGVDASGCTVSEVRTNSHTQDNVMIVTYEATAQCDGQRAITYTLTTMEPETGNG